MRIVNAELLIPTAAEIRDIVRRAYEAGRTRGREEAKCELQGTVEPPDGAGKAESASVSQKARVLTIKARAGNGWTEEQDLV